MINLWLNILCYSFSVKMIVLNNQSRVLTDINNRLTFTKYMDTIV